MSVSADADEADKSKSSSEVVTKEASTEIDKEKVIQTLIAFKQIIRYGRVNHLGDGSKHV